MDITMTMTDIRLKNYKVFDQISDSKKRGTSTNALKYIEELASLTNTKIDNWEVLRLFANEQGELPANRNRINQIFFEHQDKFKRGAKIETLTPHYLNEIRRIEREHGTPMKRKLKDRIRNLASESERLSSNLNAKLQSLATESMRLKELEGGKLLYAEHIDNVLKQGFWELNGMSGEWLKLVTRNEIFLTHKNVKQGINCKVNMGKFELHLKLTDLMVRVFKHSNNIHASSTSGTYHPHVNSNGSVCFGNMDQKRRDAVKSCDVSTLIELVKLALTVYCDNNPYQHLYKFEDMRKREQEKQEAKAEEERQMALSPEEQQAEQIARDLDAAARGELDELFA